VKIAVYPGSFDPITNGHLDVLARAATLCDQLIVAVLHNPDKKPMFTVEQRMEMIAQSVMNFPNVRVDSFMGLLVDYVKLKQASVIVRGLREVSDFENELKMAHMNRHLNADAVTIFIPTSHNYSFLSSSLVKQVASYGGNISAFVPPTVLRAIEQLQDGSVLD
jgi:pantetheine-phosphate adenylyltransferase